MYLDCHQSTQWAVSSSSEGSVGRLMLVCFAYLPPPITCPCLYPATIPARVCMPLLGPHAPPFLPLGRRPRAHLPGRDGSSDARRCGDGSRPAHQDGHGGSGASWGWGRASWCGTRRRHKGEDSPLSGGAPRNCSNVVGRWGGAEQASTSPGSYNCPGARVAP